MKTKILKRMIEQNNINIECYYYGYFKSPGLSHYPDLPWVNSDYEIIKQEQITVDQALKLATNLFNVGNKYGIFDNIDYIIMMPKKPSSISSLETVIEILVGLIKNKLNIDIKFINNIFLVKNYRKFWENRLSVAQRQIVISNKIQLLNNYINFFNEKNIIIIDDVVASGTSIVEIVKELIANNNIKSITALCYGSVYKWEAIYN